MVIGGYALAFHGYPRYTKDLDVWIECSQTNAGQLILALTEFGFGSLGLTPDDFLAENQIIQLGYSPARIDLITTADGIDFASAYPSRITVEADGVIVNVIDRENLKKNKSASGRKQDLADLEILEKGD